MAEMLRKSHIAATRFWLGTIMLVIVTSLTAAEADVEMRFEAALHREIVRGDLRGAEQEYNSILATPTTTRSVAARALFQLGQCLEKSGHRAEARDAYARVAKEYGDQPAAAAAKARLDAWEDSLPGPVNLKFEEGTPGKVPPGWYVAASPKEGDRWSSLRHDGCRAGHIGVHGCAVVLVPENAATHFSELMQNFSAAPFRGKTIRLRAWLRLETSDPADSGQLWLRVDRANEQGLHPQDPGLNVPLDPGFNVKDRLVNTTEWTRCEILTQVDDDATFIDLGINSYGKGRVWVDDVSFEVIPRQ
jgi:hypothetical protein